MKGSTIFSVMLTLILALAFIVYAQPQQGPMPISKKPMMFQHLNLTPEQQQKIAALRLDLQKKNLPLRTKLNDYRAEIKLAVVSDNYSKSRVNSLINKMSDIRKQLMLNRIEFQRKVRDILTPEQRTKFDARILSGKGMHGKRGHHHAGPCRGGRDSMPPFPHHPRW